jgi:hypothetical protein
MNWLDHLTARPSPPAWSGPAKVHNLLSAGDEHETVTAELMKDDGSAVERITCNRCHQLLPATSAFFFRAKREKRGFMYQCKACYGARQKQLRLDRAAQA